jgi:hypothetical protein
MEVFAVVAPTVPLIEVGFIKAIADAPVPFELTNDIVGTVTKQISVLGVPVAAIILSD